MSDDLFLRAKELFLGARGLDGAERGAFLDARCGDDEALRREVESLLAQPADTTAGVGSVEHPAPAGLMQPGDRVGQYVIREWLGEGGFAVVYLAEQTEPVQRRVALKVIKLGMDTRQVIARFEAERQALAMMDHPNVARVLDGGATEGGRPYFVMEQVPGVPITEHCDRQRLGIEERLELFMQVCHAVQHAHQKGIIHRDLKPSNILVTAGEGRAIAKVIDFGVAKALHQKLTERTVFTEQGQFIGTPEYMSPEQAEMTAQNIDTRSDIYSLGVLLYELLTGERPFSSETLRKAGLGEIQRIIREDEPPRPSTRLSSLGHESATSARSRRSDPATLVRRLRGDLDWIVMKCLEKDRSRRYETANGLAADLGRHLAHEPVMARPPSARYRIGKFARRNRVLFAALVVVVAALLLGIGGLAHGLITAGIQRDLAESHALAERLLRIAAENDRKELERQQLVSDWRVYLAHLWIADAAIETGGVRQARLRLDDCDPLLRGWEWRWLKARLDYSLAVLPGHERSVRSCSFSADGMTVLTGSWDGTARLWDAVSGAALHTLRGHEGYIRSATFSFDGARVVTASDDQTARVWDATNGEATAVLCGHTDRVEYASFSPDGSRIVTASSDKTARIWRIEGGPPLVVLRGHEDTVVHALFSPDGARVVTASEDGTARVWNELSDAGPVISRDHEQGVTHAAFSPDGSRIASASKDGRVRIWNALSGAMIVELSDHGDVVWHVAFSPDGSEVVTASKDKTARLWDIASGAVKAILRHNGTVRVAVFSPDGTKIVTASSDRSARVWDAATGTLVTSLRGHEDDVWCASFDPNGTRVVTASLDRTARLWNATDDADVTELAGHSEAVTFAAISPDGFTVLTQSSDNAARLWETASGIERAVLVGHQGTIRSAVFSPVGTRIVTASDDGTARVWDANTGQAKAVLQGHAERVEYATFNHDGSRIVTASSDDTIRIWETEGGRGLLVLPRHEHNVAHALFSPDGTRIVSVLEDNTARVWDVVSGKEQLALRGHTDRVTHAAFSLDGSRIVTTSWDRTARVWDASDGSESLKLLGHEDAVLSAAFLPDGSRVVTASRDDTARLWDINTGDEVAVLRGHEGAVESVSCSRDGSSIVTASLDGTARIWSLAPYRQRYAEALERRPSGKRASDLINELRTRLGDWTAVANDVRARSDLDDRTRQAALTLVTVRAERERRSAVRDDSGR